ncbi:MAG: methionine gamma-lyase family protein [Clostridiales bacterium]|nr:methionine gamma-lyase family protein [Clostridiales bacterium]
MSKGRGGGAAPDTRRFLNEAWGIDPEAVSVMEEAESSLAEDFAQIDRRAAYNQLRLLHVFQKNGVTDFHLNGSTGYGYGDAGREVLESVFADYFRGEAALVRSQIMSGTHALAIGLYGLLQPGDELVSAAGRPYDTLQKVIGLGGEAGSLLKSGVSYQEIPLKEDMGVDLPRLLESINEKTKVVLIQRSKGYQWRPSIDMPEMKGILGAVKKKKSSVVCLVDNCYCEMTEEEEPGAYGADLVIGSLIKNPGGTLAPSGGYIVGDSSCVEACSRRLSAPGLGSGLGASMGFNRPAFQGLFQSPQTVSQSMKGAVLAAAFFSALGYPVMPEGRLAGRADIVQAIELGDESKLVRFCQAIQRACPLDAAFLPEPASLPGYSHPVIMAGGGFIQGSSSELSADGPLKPPYIAYLQGGFSLAQIRLGLLLAAKALVSGPN